MCIVIFFLIFLSSFVWNNDIINLVEVTKHQINFQEMFILKNEIVGCAPTGAGTGICHMKKKNIFCLFHQLKYQVWGRTFYSTSFFIVLFIAYEKEIMLNIFTLGALYLKYSGTSGEQWERTLSPNYIRRLLLKSPS